MDDDNRIPDEELESVTGGTGGQTYFRYTVVKGDTLTKIARRYRTTVEEIIKLNMFIQDPQSITVGWVLTICANS